MPIFEYRCSECRRKFEKIVLGVSASRLPACPHCGASKAEKLVSRFATASKGSGDDLGGDFGGDLGGDFGGDDGLGEDEDDEPGDLGGDEPWGPGDPGGEDDEDDAGSSYGDDGEDDD